MVSLRNAFLMTAPVLCTGCNPAFWGNLGVLGVTVAIFLGTVFLSRSSDASRSAARSATSSTASTLVPRTIPAAASGAVQTSGAGGGRTTSPVSGRS